MKYNIWNAIAYEVTNLLIDYNPSLRNNHWIKLIRDNCFHDWIEWKTESTMKSVDQQIEMIKQEQEEEDRKQFIDPIITEQPPDGSKAQELLGGEVRISAPWYKRSQQK